MDIGNEKRERLPVPFAIAKIIHFEAVSKSGVKVVDKDGAASFNFILFVWLHRIFFLFLQIIVTG